MIVENQNLTKETEPNFWFKPNAQPEEPGPSEGQGVHGSAGSVVTPVVGSLLGPAKPLSGRPRRVLI